jgi:hypothetical protein
MGTPRGAHHCLVGAGSGRQVGHQRALKACARQTGIGDDHRDVIASENHDDDSLSNGAGRLVPANLQAAETGPAYGIQPP